MAFKFYTYPHYLIAFTYNTRGSGKLNGETSLLLAPDFLLYVYST